MSAQQNHGLTVVVKEGVRDSGGGVRRVAVACGSGERGGAGGERQRATKAAAEACGGGMWLFSVTRDGTLRGEMNIYVKDMSGHKFAERGGDVLQICVFMTDIHIIVIGIKMGLKRHNLCLYDRYFYVFMFLGMLHYTQTLVWSECVTSNKIALYFT